MRFRFKAGLEMVIHDSGDYYPGGPTGTAEDVGKRGSRGPVPEAVTHSLGICVSNLLPGTPQVQEKHNGDQKLHPTSQDAGKGVSCHHAHLCLPHGAGNGGKASASRWCRRESWALRSGRTSMLCPKVERILPGRALQAAGMSNTQPRAEGTWRVSRLPRVTSVGTAGDTLHVSPSLALPSVLYQEE